MKLQMAVDMCDTKQLLELVDMMHDLVDIVEVGTPMIILEGQLPVRSLREKYPNLTILSDTKIMDGGSLEARYAFEAGADIVTVLAAADDITIKSVVDEAQKYGKEVMADMINIADVVGCVKRLEKLNVDYICVHTASDVQATGKTPLEDLEKTVATVKKAKVAVAGGINSRIIKPIVELRPNVVIIGSSLACAPDPRQAAITYQKIIKNL